MMMMTNNQYEEAFGVPDSVLRGSTGIREGSIGFQHDSRRHAVSIRTHVFRHVCALEIFLDNVCKCERCIRPTSQKQAKTSLH